MLNPFPFLESLMDKQIIVKLKWGQEYRGNLLSVDKYFNIRITSTEEWVDDNCLGELGDVLIRCNNILYIRDPFS